MKISNDFLRMRLNRLRIPKKKVRCGGRSGMMMGLILVALMFLPFQLARAQTSKEKPKEKSKRYPVQPIDIKKLDRPDFEKLANNIEQLSVQAVVYSKVSQPLEDAFNGNAREARKIIAIKLEVLRKLAQAIPLAVGSMEEFHVNTDFLVAQWEADTKVIQSQINSLEQEIAEVASRIEQKGRDKVHKGMWQLLSSKLERRDELAADVDKLGEMKSGINVLLNDLVDVNESIDTFKSLTKEEALKQRDSLRRSRLAKQSEMLHRQASALAKSIRGLGQGWKSLPEGGTKPIIPSRIPGFKVNEVELSPARRSEVEAYLDSLNK